MKPRQIRLSDQWKALRWLAPRVWRADRRLALGVLLLAPVQALSPTVVAVAGGGLAATVAAGVAAPGAGVAWLIVLLGAVLLAGCAAALSDYCLQRLGDRLELTLSSELIAHAGALDVAQFDDPDVQDRMHRAMRKAGRGAHKFFQQSLGILIAAIELASLFGVLFVVAPLPTLVLTPAVAPMFWFYWRLVRKRHETEVATTRIERLGNYLRTKVASPKSAAATKLLDLAPYVVRRYGETAGEVHRAYQKTYWFEAVGYMLVSLAFVVGLGAAIGFNLSQVLSGLLEPRRFVVFWMATWRFRNTMENLARRISVELESGLQLLHLVEFLDLRPEAPRDGAFAPAACRGEIELQGVTFRYPAAEQPTLVDFNLTLAAGETLLLVGGSGTGKSTLAHLLARLYDPEQGRVLLDGVDLREWEPEALRRQIAYAFQKSAPFEGTVHENLALGDWRRLLDDRSAVERLAQDCGVEELIQSLPQGYDTILGRVFGKHDLSGGQWQRITLARALARDARVVVLDEPTAHLDHETEEELLGWLKQRLVGRTAVIISHQLSAAQLADRVAVMESGKIVEQGTHEELLALEGAYARLWRRHEEPRGARRARRKAS